MRTLAISLSVRSGAPMFSDLFLTLCEFGLKAIDSASRLIHRLSRGDQLRSN